MRILHFYQVWDADPETARREAAAQATWPVFHQTEHLDVTPAAFRLGSDTRDGTAVGARPVPFVRDVFDWAVLEHQGHQKFAFSNGDVHIVSDAAERVNDSLNRHSCGYSFRVDFRPDRMPPGPMTMRELGTHLEGHWYPGADLFWFSRQWWEDHRLDCPDALLGYEGWDFCMKRMMHESGFPEAMDWLIWHEEHDNHWKRTLETSPGQIYNRKLCRAWAERHGYQHLIREKGFLFT